MQGFCWLWFHWRTLSGCFTNRFDANQKPCSTFGWGGRIRTSVWRNQNPLPYHLATPQPPWQVNRKPLSRQQDRWRTLAMLASRSKPIMARGWDRRRPSGPVGRAAISRLFPYYKRFSRIWQQDIRGFG